MEMTGFDVSVYRLKLSKLLFSKFAFEDENNITINILKCTDSFYLLYFRSLVYVQIFVQMVLLSLLD